MTQQFDPLLDLLVQNGVLDKDGVDTIREEQANSGGKTVREIIVDGGYLDEDTLLGMMAAYQGCEVVDLSQMELDDDVVNAIPASIARMYNVLCVGVDGNSVTLATSSLVDPRVADEVAFSLSKEVRFVMAREKDVNERIAQHYGDASDSVADMLKSLGEGMEGDESLKSDPNDVAALEGAANNNAVVKFVNMILYQGVVDRAADIHIEPFEHDFKIRYRVDGALYEVKAPDVSMAPAIISRVKIMANLNIAERRIPQDGRIAITVAGRPVDLRVSCLPTTHGESVVMRILDQSATSLDLENVGLPEDVYEQITMDIEKPNGIIVVTGPTGSGKTTTLYSVLRRINTIDSKLLTAEEPVEYDMDGIVQVPINHEVGNTFAKVLRAFLRQDPDIIMVGEIRDLETAEIAIQAALTGHLVFSTLHTNDAPSAVTRLTDMGCKPFLVASAVRACLAQRLVRAICPNCKEEYTPTERDLKMLGSIAKVIPERMYVGKGCAKCNGGYKGRKGIFEIFEVDDTIQRLIFDHAPSAVLRERAREMGMRTLREDGMLKVASGMTSLREVLQATMGDAD